MGQEGRVMDDAVRYNVTCTNPEGILEICLSGKIIGMPVSFVHYRWEAEWELRGRNDSRCSILLF
jgi:hypothetical protein